MPGFSAAAPTARDFVAEAGPNAQIYVGIMCDFLMFLCVLPNPICFAVFNRGETLNIRFQSAIFHVRWEFAVETGSNPKGV